MGVRIRAAGGEKRRLRTTLLVSLLLPLVLSLGPDEKGDGLAPRRIAIRVSESFSSGADFEPFSSFARRQGIQIDIGAEDREVRSGWEVVRVASVPLSSRFRRLLARFPVRIDGGGFEFDGRLYRAVEDGIALSDPARPEETLVFGNSREAAIRLVYWGFRRSAHPGGYFVISGGLFKQGRFLAGKASLAIDRTEDRDGIAARDEFFRSQKIEERDGVRWRFRETERGGFSRWEPVLRRFLARSRPDSIEVSLFPDPATKGRYTGSSRPADLSWEKPLRIDLDISAPAEPDVITPVLAAAAFAADESRLAKRPVLLMALGARASGRWWGRDAATLGAFAHQAGVEPTFQEIMAADPKIPPIVRVIPVGAAASWLEAGVRSEGEAAVRRALLASDSELEPSLRRWRGKSVEERVLPLPRRPLPSGFLRGLSYAMTNHVDASYASPRSRETLERLAKLSVNSISVMPYGFCRSARSASISFIHQHPGGETDEGTVRAITDARALGMTAMVKPQIWVGQGAFAGSIAMEREDDWQRWFNDYRRFIVHHALVAEAAGAELFSVGTELVGTEQRISDWRNTIAAVRLATGAPLLYASNWAAGAPRVPFWDALDLVGVDFYDPLSKDPGASDAALEEGVRTAVQPLEQLVRRTGKPIVFAEAGYPPVRGAWITPHDENSGRPAAPGDAARAVAAVFRALEEKSWWKGVYWWKAFSGGQSSGPGERSFNLLGTPCERAIADGFARQVRGQRP